MKVYTLESINGLEDQELRSVHLSLAKAKGTALRLSGQDVLTWQFKGHSMDESSPRLWLSDTGEMRWWITEMEAK